jgi:hypothetical protein
MVRKVKRNLLAVCIAVAVIAMLVVPVSAVVPPVLPTKSPLPKGQPFETIWKWMLVLQDQIKAIPAGPTGATGPIGPTGPTGATGVPGAGLVVRCSEATGENWRSFDPITHACDLRCPPNTDLVGFTFDGIIRSYSDPGVEWQSSDPAYVFRFFDDRDAIDHWGSGLCI